MSTLLSHLNLFGTSPTSTQQPAKPTYFRGKMSKVLRLSMRDLPSFSKKSPATISMLNLSPNHAAATETALNSVKSLLVQASQALQQNQDTIRSLMAERDKLQRELSLRPSSDEFVLVQEQLKSQRELSSMDRAQIKQLHSLAEQQELVIVQNEQRLHESNQSKTELVVRNRNLLAAQTQEKSHINSLERQLQLSKQELDRLREELHFKSDDIRSCHERLQTAMSTHHATHSTQRQSEQVRDTSPHGIFIPEDFLELCQPGGGVVHTPEQFVEVIEHRFLNRRSSGDLDRLRSMIDPTNTLSDREVGDHLEHLLAQVNEQSVEERTTIAQLCALIPDSFVSASTDPRLVLEEFLRHAQVVVSKSFLDRLGMLVPKECQEGGLSPEDLLDSLHRFLAEREGSQLHLQELLQERESDVTALKELLSQSNSKIEGNINESERLRSRCNSVQNQLERSFSQDGKCLACITKKRLLKDLEHQLLSVANEFESFQVQMGELRSKTSHQTSALKSKDLCIERLQMQIMEITADWQCHTPKEDVSSTKTTTSRATTSWTSSSQPPHNHVPY